MPARMDARTAAVRGQQRIDDDELRAFMRTQQQQIELLTSIVNRLATPSAHAPTQTPAAAALPKITVNALWFLYYETIKDKSWAKNVRDLMVAPLAHFGERIASELRRSDWTFYRDHVRKKQTTRFGGAPSVSTRNLELIRMKVVLNFGVQEEKLESNPLAAVKPEAKRPPRETTIADDGVERIEVAADPILWAYVITGIDSGMREAEVRGLKWSQIKSGGRVAVSWTAAKTKRSRSVRLSARAMAALDALPRGFGGYVFENPMTSKPYSRTYFWEKWRSVCVDAKLIAADGDERVHYHDSRHTFVTRTVERGTPLAVAMRAAGHVTLAQVSRYFHLEEGALDAMKARNDAAIGGDRIGPRRAESSSMDGDSRPASKKVVDA